MPSIQKLPGSRAAVSAVLFFLLGCALLSLAGCAGTGFAPTPAGAVVGRANEYDYSPSIIQVGHVQQIWWCGEGSNPNAPGPFTDTIQYESIDLVTGQRNGPLTVLGGTPGTWDGQYTCNPTVVQGTFTNPLGDGATYTYALYYEATSQVIVSNNSLGVAFSNDGIHWKKYPSPVIPSVNPNFAGPAQPAAVNMDGKQAVSLFYEDDEPPLTMDTHVETTSPDGIHFTRAGILTTKGITIPANLDSWGNIAYNPADKSWYATFNQTTRGLSETGGVVERGSWGLQLYRISQDDLLVGNTGWQLLKNIDTNSTGYVALFDAGIGRDPYGNVYLDSSGTIQLFPSFSNVQPSWNALPAAATTAADPNAWDIGMYIWSPGDSQTELDRYNNGTAHLVTTGWIDPAGGFSVEKKLGHVYQYPQQGALVALYGCKAGTIDAFLSLDMACEGQRMIGVNGYIYAQPVTGLTLTPLYRCSTATDHFASSDPKCEGAHTDSLLGYILPE